ncbi:MAG: O-antigen ligase family protein [Candidatus Omnitrophica bacterium]|nr:O-antigen ligase family protein [Candidatus Omnitrophota bacterium]
MSKERVANISDKIIEYSLYGLIFYIPISIALVEIFTSLVVLVFIVKKITQPDFSFIKKNKFIYFFLGLFVLFMGLSLFNSGPYLTKSLRVIFSKWLAYILVFTAAADTLGTRKQIRNALVVLSFSAALAVLSGLMQYFFGFEFLRGRELAGEAITSAFKNPNNFAAYLSLLIPIVIGLSLLKFKNKIYKIGVMLLLALSITTLLFTFSRGGWLGFLAGASLLMVLLRKYRVGLVAIGGFIAFLSFLPQLQERFLCTFSAFGDANRFTIWQGAWGMIKENPILGKGLGTFMDYSLQYTEGFGIYYAHNCYLQIWAETGIFSLLSFLIFSGLLLYLAIKSTKKDITSNLSILSIGISCGIFGFLVHSFFDTQLYSVQLQAFFWLMAGILFAVVNLTRARNNKNDTK